MTITFYKTKGDISKPTLVMTAKKLKKSHEITDHDKEIINQDERLFGEEDIRRMFNLFERNNFRENPICEYVLGWKDNNQKENDWADMNEVNRCECFIHLYIIMLFYILIMILYYIPLFGGIFPLG